MVLVHPVPALFGRTTLRGLGSPEDAADDPAVSYSAAALRGRSGIRGLGWPQGAADDSAEATCVPSRDGATRQRSQCHCGTATGVIPCRAEDSRQSGGATMTTESSPVRPVTRTRTWL